jgi:hypothetical protein
MMRGLCRATNPAWCVRRAQGACAIKRLPKGRLGTPATAGRY